MNERGYPFKIFHEDGHTRTVLRNLILAFMICIFFVEEGGKKLLNLLQTINIIYSTKD
jgi:hypothetical protein